MTTRQEFRLLALLLAMIGCLLSASAAGLGSPQEQGQEKGDREKGDTPRQSQLTKQQGGRILVDEKGRGDTQIFRGELIRPLVPAGASGPSAPEEGSFRLRPGDVLEIECSVPKNIPGNMIFHIDDEEVMKLVPIGVRHLMPVSMVGGEPKKITGMVRGLALFQAEKEGETTIRLDLGLRQFQYKVKVARGEGD